MWSTNLYHMMLNPLTVLLPVLILIQLIVTNAQTANCPSMCLCIWRGGKQTSLCERQGLIAVPTGIMSSTQVLHLNGNNFQILPSRVFQERGLINLQKVFLSECKLGEIAKDAFVQLTNLVELDLSSNLLTSVPSASLNECPSLRRLLLSSNPIRVIKSEAFINLTNLVFIDLSSNQIDLIESHAFRGLSKLQFLKLESNRLQTLAPTVVADLPALFSFDLHQNQWNCDCDLRPSREWMIRNNVPQSVPPACSTPQRLAGVLWNSIEIEEFACAPQFHSKMTEFTQIIGNNISISCVVSGLPMPTIHWFIDDGFNRNLSLPAVRGDRYVIHEERVGAILSSVLTIIHLEADDSQHFICEAENRGGVSLLNFTVSVVAIPTSSPSTSWAKVEIAGALVGLVFVFVLVFILVTVILLRAKRTSVVHAPKLAPIDVLQNVENAERKAKSADSLKPEIALISSVVNADHDKAKDSNGSSSGYGSGLLTPDVAKTGTNYVVMNGGPRVNLVTTVAQQNFYHPTSAKEYTNYSFTDYNNYQQVYDEHLPHHEIQENQNSYKNFSDSIYVSDPTFHCYTNAALNLNPITPDTQISSTQTTPSQWQELDLNVHKLLVQPAIVRYSPDVNSIQSQQQQANSSTDYGLAGTQV